jgi:peptidoglycan/LPS O-acetylase OafA/YrhL
MVAAGGDRKNRHRIPTELLSTPLFPDLSSILRILGNLSQRSFTEAQSNPVGTGNRNIFLFGNYYQGLHHFPENGFSHAWSLGVEEQYYLVWPAVVLLMASKPKQLLRITCAAIVAVWIYRNVLQLAGAREEYIYTAFETRIDHLLIGCVLAISLRYGYFARFWRIVCAQAAYMLLPTGLLLVSITAVSFLGTNYRNTVGFIVDPLLVAVLLAQLLATRNRWLAWMDSAPVIYLGTISYSTYLYHKMAAGFTRQIGVAAALPASGLDWDRRDLCGRKLLNYVIERPFLTLRTRIEKKPIPVRVRAAVPG